MRRHGAGVNTTAPERSADILARAERTATFAQLTLSVVLLWQLVTAHAVTWPLLAIVLGCALVAAGARRARVAAAHELELPA